MICCAGHARTRQGLVQYLLRVLGRQRRHLAGEDVAQQAGTMLEAKRLAMLRVRQR